MGEKAVGGAVLGSAPVCVCAVEVHVVPKQSWMLLAMVAIESAVRTLFVEVFSWILVRG